MCINKPSKKRTNPNVNPAVAGNENQTCATFKITDTKLYIPVVTLSTENDKLQEQLKAGFKRTIKWNKYRSEITNQTKNNNLLIYIILFILYYIMFS